MYSSYHWDNSLKLVYCHKAYKHMKITQKISLALGIGLPLILVAILWVSMQIKQKQIPDPQYSFLYTVQYASPARLISRDHKIYLYMPKDRVVERFPPLYYYDFNNHTATEINYQKPNIGPSNEQYILIYQPKGYLIINNQSSPDGYDYRYGSKGAILGLFNSGSRHRQYLIKQGKQLELHIEPPNRYIKILGWLTPET